MEKFIKKYCLRIPTYINLLYCSKKNILVLFNENNKKFKKYLEPTNKVIIIKKYRSIKVTSIPYKLTTNLQNKRSKAYQGTLTAMLKQIILELSSTNVCKKLNLIGIGYKVTIIKIKNVNLLHFKLGYSHNIYFKISKNLNIFCIKNKRLFISGKSVKYVSKIAAYIKTFKKIDIYKGKGILYEAEKLTLKEGKKI